jgi:hypothetical protein
MFPVRRWWDCLWPWFTGATAPQTPVPPPPSVRPAWAGPTLFLGPLLTYGQRLGYRTDRGNHIPPQPSGVDSAGLGPRPRNGGPGYPVPALDQGGPGMSGGIRRNSIHWIDG